MESTEKLAIGDRVKIFLDAEHWGAGGWFPGTIVRIEPYSQHRRFYWVHLDAPQGQMPTMISVFNPRNIEKIEDQNNL
jgi:hypothetical protein